MDHDDESHHMLLPSESPTTSEMLHVPQVNPNCKPKIGITFNSLDDVFVFYKQYAKEGGFGVRSSSSKIRKDDNEIYWKEYVCSKQGTSSIKVDSNKKRCHGELRAQCKAKISVTKRKGEELYKLSNFFEGHSHILTSPDKVHLLRSHRHVSEGIQSLTKLVSKANIPTHKLVSLLELQAGGIQNIGCTEKDITNFKRDMKKNLKGHDVDLLNEHFLSEQEKFLLFFFKIKANEQEKLTHCFWEDSTSRKAYELYGDVVVFDTTYNTNRYGMIFAPLVGVNNHSQTVIFGCAFLSDETSDSFVWIFKEWMKAMPGGPPKMIITDQDPAMEKAIIQALPTTLHRNCIWHILAKFSIRVGAALYVDCYADFEECIWNPETAEEFDTKWNEVINKHELSDNVWLKTMYARRFMWVPVYVNHVFSARMSSSQRAESSHSFFKKYISNENSLMDFLVQFERALSRQRQKVLCADHKDINEKPALRTPLLMEKQMSEIYTRTIFLKFQNELWKSLVYVVEASNKNENICVYKVKRTNVVTSKFREVFYDMDFLKCSCKKFESEGILCRHILAYYKFKQILYVQKEYIMHRWTKTITSVEILDDDGRTELHVCDNSLLTRRNALSQLASSIIADASLSEVATNLLKEHLRSSQQIINATTKIKGKEVYNEDIQIPRQHIFNEPDEVRAKGCGKKQKGGRKTGKVSLGFAMGVGKGGYHTTKEIVQ